MSSNLDSKITFKFEHNDTPYQFTLPSTGRNLFDRMKKLIRDVIGPTEQRMFWDDGESLHYFNDASDLAAAIQFAEIEAANTGVPPCVYVQFEDKTRIPAASVLYLAKKVQQMAVAIAAPLATIERLLLAAAHTTDADERKTLLIKVIEIFNELREKSGNDPRKVKKVEKEKELEYVDALSMFFKLTHSRDFKALFGTEEGEWIIGYVQYCLNELIENQMESVKEREVEGEETDQVSFERDVAMEHDSDKEEDVFKRIYCYEDSEDEEEKEGKLLPNNRFAYTENGTSYRFTLPENLDDLCDSARERVLAVIGPLRQKMFWNDGVSLKSLDHESKLSSTTAFVENEAKDAGSCVRIEHVQHQPAALKTLADAAYSKSMQPAAATAAVAADLSSSAAEPAAVAATDMLLQTPSMVVEACKEQITTVIDMMLSDAVAMRKKCEMRRETGNRSNEKERYTAVMGSEAFWTLARKFGMEEELRDGLTRDENRLTADHACCILQETASLKYKEMISNSLSKSMLKDLSEDISLMVSVIDATLEKQMEAYCELEKQLERLDSEKNGESDDDEYETGDEEDSDEDEESSDDGTENEDEEENLMNSTSLPREEEEGRRPYLSDLPNEVLVKIIEEDCIELKDRMRLSMTCKKMELVVAQSDFHAKKIFIKKKATVRSGFSSEQELSKRCFRRALIDNIFIYYGEMNVQELLQLSEHLSCNHLMIRAEQNREFDSRIFLVIERLNPRNELELYLEGTPVNIKPGHFLNLPPVSKLQLSTNPALFEVIDTIIIELVARHRDVYVSPDQKLTLQLDDAAKIIAERGHILKFYMELQYLSEQLQIIGVEFNGDRLTTTDPSIKVSTEDHTSGYTLRRTVKQHAIDVNKIRIIISPYWRENNKFTVIMEKSN